MVQLIAATASIDKKFRDRFRIVVVGEGRRRRYRKLARELGIGARVDFVGATDVPQEFYAAADVYCQPTFYDPCSLTVLEAMASGLAVITTRFNGVGELIENELQGYILEHPRRISDLVRHLESLVEAQLRIAMGEAARRTALEHTLEKNYREMLIVFQRAAGETSEGA